jgi:hypothetical protein
MSKIQDTIRGIGERVDARIRERAAREGKSMNETVLEALKSGLGIDDGEIRCGDLDDLVGTWVHDPAFDQAIQEMDRIDPELWK